MEDVLILTGFMGVGKTATGRELARLLGWDFVDLDREIEASEGQTIPAIFAAHGEEHFRSIECQVLEKVLRRRRTVVATGGGAILGERNRKLLAGRQVFYLYASPQECMRRLRKSKDFRPLLSGPDPAQRILQIYAQREVLYEAVGRKVDTEGQSPEAVAQTIAEHIRPDLVAVTG